MPALNLCSLPHPRRIGFGALSLGAATSKMQCSGPELPGDSLKRRLDRGSLQSRTIEDVQGFDLVQIIFPEGGCEDASRAGCINPDNQGCWSSVHGHAWLGRLDADDLFVRHLKALPVPDHGRLTASNSIGIACGQPQILQPPRSDDRA